METLNYFSGGLRAKRAYPGLMLRIMVVPFLIAGLAVFLFSNDLDTDVEVYVITLLVLLSITWPGLLAFFLLSGWKRDKRASA